jgi:hypothetical protein
MEQEKADFPVVLMARVLGVARAGFYAWRRAGRPGPKPPEPLPAAASGLGRPQPESVPKPPMAAAEGAWPAVRAWLKAWVWHVWNVSKGRYGARRVKAQLALEPGVNLSLWLVGRLMGELGVQGVQPRASKRTTIPAPDAPNRPDLLRRRFNPPVPGTWTVGDITYVRTGEGWVYLATVIDLTTRMVIGWNIADHMRTSLVAGALEMAHKSGMLAGGAIFHSDRGAQYTSAEYARLAARLDVRLSVGRTGSCHDKEWVSYCTSCRCSGVSPLFDWFSLLDGRVGMFRGWRVEHPLWFVGGLVGVDQAGAGPVVDGGDVHAEGVG